MRNRHIELLEKNWKSIYTIEMVVRVHTKKRGCDVEYGTGHTVQNGSVQDGLKTTGWGSCRGRCNQSSSMKIIFEFIAQLIVHPNLVLYTVLNCTAEEDRLPYNYRCCVAHVNHSTQSEHLTFRIVFIGLYTLHIVDRFVFSRSWHCVSSH